MIAVDAMGGDSAPNVTVCGSIKAAKMGISVCLFGDQEQLEPLLYKIYADWQQLPISLEHCTQVIGMGEEPSKMVLQKKDSSLVRAIQAVADGKASAFFSAGNSGAVLVAATLILGRVNGVLRPAIGDFLPTKRGSIFCIDLGANADAKPEYLEQFALIGHLYVKLIKQIDSPRVALLSNGHEPYKGSAAVKKAYERLEQSVLIEFVGNLEPRDMFDDKADVLVCDGFLGNVLLKSMQGTARTIMYWLKAELMCSWWRKLLAIFNRGTFKSIKKKLDYAMRGGALLLGVRHPVVIAHGCSTEIAIINGIRFANHIVQQKIVPTFNAELSLLIQQHGGPGVVRKLRSIFKSVHS